MSHNIVKNNIAYIKNIFAVLIDNIIRLILGFIISALIARYFGPGKFGQINYVTAFISILQVFVLFGIGDIIVRDLGLGYYNERVILGSVIKSRLFLAIIAYFLGFIVFFYCWGNNKSLIKIYYVLGLQLFMLPFFSLKQWFQIKTLNKYVLIASQVSFFYLLTGKMLFLFIGKDIFIYCIILISSTLVEIIILCVLFIKKSRLTFSSMKFNKTYSKQLYKSGVPLLFTSFFYVFFLKIDQLMIGNMLSEADLGIYSIGVTISELVCFIPIGIMNGIYPKIVKAKKIGQYENLIIKIGSFNIFICFIFALCLTIIVPKYIDLIYGSEYIRAAQVIQIHGWAGIFAAITYTHNCFLVFENMQRYTLYATSIGCMLNVILNYFMIKKWGINGAALATLISQFFAFYLCYAFFKDKRTFLFRTKSILDLFKNPVSLVISCLRALRNCSFL
jgi:PST family polysaccharide transporter